MTRNWIAANLVLLLIAALLGWQLNVSVKRFNTENDLTKLQPVQDLKQKITQEGSLPQPPPPKRYNASEFGIIPAQNLFSETRTKEEKTDAPVVVEVQPLAVKPVLVGVTLSGNQRLAAVIDPATAGGSRKSQTKRVGDTYQGYTITDITFDQLVLESGSRREVIPLFDASKHPVQTGKTAIQPTRVVAFGGGGAAGIPGAPVPTVVPASAGRPAGSSGVVPVGGAATGAAAAQGAVVRGTAPPPIRQQVPGGSPQPPPSWNERTDEQGRRVIRTPFGDVVRPNPPNQ